VFTSGSCFFDKSGESLKAFSVRDGMGLSLLREDSVEVFVITSENSDIVGSRMKKLQIKNYYPNIKDKYAKVEEILTNKHLKWSEIAYIGDDINDLSSLLSAGWSFCPRDAVEQVKSAADVILHAKGGREAVREAINVVLQYNQRGELQ